MHSPCLFNDQLLFVSEDDLWSTDLNATSPRRLTHGLGIIRNPQFSPNGKHIAFSATSEGAEEIYLMTTNGANAKRLTYLGHQAKFCIWLDNNTLILPVTTRARSDKINSIVWTSTVAILLCFPTDQQTTSA